MQKQLSCTPVITFWAMFVAHLPRHFPLLHSLDKPFHSDESSDLISGIFCEDGSQLGDECPYEFKTPSLSFVFFATQGSVLMAFMAFFVRSHFMSLQTLDSPLPSS